ncbi:MAG: alpha/beta hydrolase [Planctomycetaceae bacterium]|nr:alpha/beta hydrolase [Planctomycetaceae bacterium]
MKKHVVFSVFGVILLLAGVCSLVQAQDEYRVWPEKAPGVTEELPDKMRDAGAFSFVTTPTIRVFVPEKKTSDTCIILLPGGAYSVCGNDVWQARYFADRGITTVLLKYRVPRPQGMKKHIPAFQDAQRAIRLTRSMAEKYGFNPERIGVMGGSAGGHLVTMCCTSSSIQSYEPIDEIDKLPTHVAFGIAKYPAYVLEDGRDQANNKETKGNYAKIVDDFIFDSKTCPMCFVHGDADVYSPMGSIALYHKLRTMNIPAELHIWAKAPHGFGKINDTNREQIGFWLDAVWDWIEVMKFN